jgi:predicted DNA-binding antitoxin AbrB/MazE fold protein
MSKTTFPAQLVPVTVDAVYTNGVLRPLRRLTLAEYQRVSLQILPSRSHERKAKPPNPDRSKREGL